MRVAGMILAAGAGGRLAPLTSHIPKPLLPILDRSLLRHQIGRLEDVGVEKIYVNLHHQAETVAHHLRPTAPKVTCRVENELSGPAGALALFADTLTDHDAVLVTSCDVLVGEGLGHLLRRHIESRAVMTFGVAYRTGAKSFGVLDIDCDDHVTATREKPDVEDDEIFPISAGVYCLGSDAVEVAAQLKARAATIDYARELAPELLNRGTKVMSHRLKGYWRDVGTPSSLSAANRDALEGRIPWLRDQLPGMHSSGRSSIAFVHQTAVIEAGATLEGTVVGAGAHVGEAAHLSETLVLPGAMVPAGSIVVGGIVAGMPQVDHEPRPRPLFSAGSR